MAWHPSDRLFRQAADNAFGQNAAQDSDDQSGDAELPEGATSTGSEAQDAAMGVGLDAASQPPSCSYCGSTEFKDQTDNGRAQQATCAACGGTMSSINGNQWTPELIGDPSNHPSPGPDPLSGGVGGAANATDALTRDPERRGSLRTAALSWDEIGDRHPHIYGDSEIHGDAADGADGPGIGDAANYLAHERAEDPDAESHSVHDLDFHEQTVHPRHIDYSPSGVNDDRVTRAREGYRQHPEKMPPLVLVHRHGVYQVADGHHRAEAAHGLKMPVKAYVAHSPYPDEPFRDGEKAPFYRAEPVSRTAAADGPDWCAYRHAAHCWYPGSSLSVPQDRGVCPWDTSWQQAICPISDPGPMAVIRAKGSADDEHHRVYLRFGHWPKNERSENSITGFPEDGVSVYDLDHHGEPKDPDPHMSRGHAHDEHCDPDCDLDADNDDYGNDTLEEMNGRVSRAERGRHQGHDRPSERAHLVKGEMVGFGHDSEPLLRNVRRVGDWIDHKHLFFPGAEPHRLARSADDENYEPPEEHPTIRAKGSVDASLRALAKIAQNDPDFAFQVTAAWADVRNKAKRIRAEGRVRITVASNDGVAGEVKGDHHVYESVLTFIPGSRKVGTWNCGCRWAAFAWGRSPAYKRFEGRMCSHALAMQFEAQSRGMFGKEIHPNEVRPDWLKPHSPVVIQNDRDTNKNRTRRAVPPGNMKRTFSSIQPPYTGEIFAQNVLGQYNEFIARDERAASLQTDMDQWAHEAMIEFDQLLDEYHRRPVTALTKDMLDADEDPPALIKILQQFGLTHAGAKSVLDEALGRVAVQDEQPDWGVHWHGSASGDLHGGPWGLHLASNEKAAREVLNGRVGYPAEGQWDGTREYGKTLLAGKQTLKDRKQWPSGYSRTAPEEDHYPTGDATFMSGEPVEMHHKPDVFPVRITGPMTNTPDAPMSDGDANGAMKRNVTRGTAKRGYFYTNRHEGDEGEVSAVVPGSDHIERLPRDQTHTAVETAEERKKKHQHDTSDARRHAPDFGVGVPRWGLPEEWCDQCDGSGCGHCGGTGQVVTMPLGGTHTTADPIPDQNHDAGPLISGGISDTSSLRVDDATHGWLGQTEVQADSALRFTGGHSDADDFDLFGSDLREGAAAFLPVSDVVELGAGDHVPQVLAGRDIAGVSDDGTGIAHISGVGPAVRPDHAWAAGAGVGAVPEQTVPGMLHSAGPEMAGVRATGAVDPRFISGIDADGLPTSADPRALRHDAYGSKKKSDAPFVSGVALKAADTGRVLMLQRSLEDEDDPARGTWEFPGGHHEDGDLTSLHAGLREWQEEVGQPFPDNGVVHHTWTSPNGVYQGHVVVIPSEKDLSMKDGRVIPNPDDPKGDCHEQAAWWDIDHARKNPALRPELKSAPWKDIAKAGEQKTASAWDSLESLNPPPGRGVEEPSHSNSQNPASTGFLTAQDPESWDQIGDLPTTLAPSNSIDASRHVPENDAETMPWGYDDLTEFREDHPDLTPTATLHDHPEPALPSTDGAEDDAFWDAGYQPPETQGEIDATDVSAVPNSVHASTGGVADIVAKFQATAGAQSLQANGPAPAKGDDMSFDIAAAARAHLAGNGGNQHTALKRFDFGEQQDLITEGLRDKVRARNFGDLQIEGTHYEALAQALTAQGLDGDDDAESLF